MRKVISEEVIHPGCFPAFGPRCWDKLQHLCYPTQDKQFGGWMNRFQRLLLQWLKSMMIFFFLFGIYFYDFCFILCTDKFCAVRLGSCIQLSVCNFKLKQLTQSSRIAEYLWILKKGSLFLEKWEGFTVGLRKSCSGRCGLHHGRCSEVSWGAAACTLADKEKAATGWSKMIHSE